MGVDARADRAVGQLRGPQHAADRTSENADDHRYLQSVAAKYGIYFSRPGNGICHQVHLERFGAPGQDAARLRQPHAHRRRPGDAGHRRGRARRGRGDGRRRRSTSPCPKVVRRAPDRQARRLGVGQGRHPGAAAPADGQGRRRQDLRVLRARRGHAVACPSARRSPTWAPSWAPPPRIFPSDERDAAVPRRRRGARRTGSRSRPTPDAAYDEVIEIDLSTLEPLVACPHSPDNVVPVREVAGTPVDQVCIGSLHQLLATRT